MHNIHIRHLCLHHMSTKYAVYAKYAEARFFDVLQLGLAVYLKIHCTYLLYIEYNFLY